MAKIEQLFCGIIPGNPDAGRTVLAHSPGMGAAVSDEIVGLCVGWGSTPAGGLNRPALLSFPLASTMPAIRGKLFTVIRVTAGVPACFHAVVLSKADYRNFDYNPYALARVASFLDAWSPQERLSSGLIEPPPEKHLLVSTPASQDIGIVDEALQQFLVKGKLVMNLEAPSKESDRALDLLIQVMPISAREKLFFASFAPSGENRYGLAAAYAPETPFSSWQRLFMTMIEQGAPEQIRKYVATVRNGLAAGSFDGVSPTQNISADLGAKPRPLSNMGVEPVSSRNVPLNRNQPPAPLVKPPVQRAQPMVVPITAYGGTASGAGVGKSRGSTFERRPDSQGRARLVRQAVPLKRPGRGRSHRTLGFFVTIVLMLAASWVYLDRSGKGDEWGIFDLANLGQKQKAEKQTPTLLEVVDVGAEYDRLLGRMQRSNILPGSDRDQALRRAQADLQADAAGPLLVQAEYFLQLAKDGIQQGSRPDREVKRLGSLDNQGQVLYAEMGRLELAFYSFKNGVLWQDLGGLPDQGVAARRDSLWKANRPGLEEVGHELGSGQIWTSLKSAKRKVSGMASLLALFQAPSWSAQWEKEMKRAAEKVPPTASSMSRAYRNNAFTLVRLKKAERGQANLKAAYGDPLAKGTWPSPAVQDILKELRHKVGLFGNQELPPLIEGSLGLYGQLADPPGLIQKVSQNPEEMTSLQANPAAKFDPAVFHGFLSRVSFEAAGLLLDEGINPDELPKQLTTSGAPLLIEGFHQMRKGNRHTADWSSLAALGSESFLGKWAGAMAEDVQQQTQVLLQAMDQSWLESVELSAQLNERAKAGEDWTATWVDLSDQVDQVLKCSPAMVQDDSERKAKWDQTLGLKAALDQARPLSLEAVVIRLEQDQLGRASQVVLEFQLLGSEKVFQSGPVDMGLAAPEGTGWVGTAALDWVADISPRDSFVSRVRLRGNTENLLEVSYPAMSDRVGPGALHRPRRGEGGSLTFKVGQDWWQGLQMPGLP